MTKGINMTFWLWVFKIYMILLSIPPLIALATVIAVFWFAGGTWGTLAFIIALSIYGPVLALPFIFPEIPRLIEKFGFSK